MPDIPNYVNTIAQRLAGLFTFSVEASKEIDAFFDRQSGTAPRLSALALEQGRALSYLHAAEYSLLPAFSNPGSLTFPPSRVAVTIENARMALLKGNCTLIIWEHAPSGDRIESLSASDLTVFSGDASKMNRFSPGKSTNEGLDHYQIRDYAGLLQSLHFGSGWEPATRVVESGVLSIQSLLWQLKLAVVESSTDEELGEALADIGPEPLGA